MDENIRRRLAQVRRGEVPEGYKRTKAGILPDEWPAQAAKKLFYSVSNKGGDGLQVLSATQDSGVIPRNSLDIDIKYDAGNLSGYKRVEQGDFVISLRSFQGGIEYSLYDGLISPAYTVIKPLHPIADGYYKAYFKTGDFIGRLNRGTYGIRDGKQVSFADFGELYVPFPPLDEQRAIAEILSAQDSVIALKERLIAEKVRQKRGLMQRFFRSRISYKKPLSELAKITMGQSPNSANYHSAQNGLPLIQGNADIRNRKSCPRMYTTEITKRCGKGDILLSVRAPVGTVARSEIDACIGRGICAIDGGQKTEYLYQYLLYFEDKWGRVAQGSTFEAISGQHIASLQVPLSGMEETVSRILSAADREINLLQRGLEQEIRRKKALTQYLLSGLVRV